MNISAEISALKLERCDIKMLEVLAAAKDKTLRWQTVMEDVTQPPKVPGGPRTTKATVVEGLERLVNNFCDENPHLVTHKVDDLVTVGAGGIEKRHPRDDYVERCTISRLEKLVMLQPPLIQHLGTPDEETAKMPTRALRLTAEGEEVLKAWRENGIQSVPYPDAEAAKVTEAPKAGKGEKVGAGA